MVKQLFLLSKVLFGGKDVLVLSKVWDKIVSGNFLCLLWNGKLMAMLSFSLRDVKSCELDVAVLAKIRNEVVSWWWLWRVECGMKLLF